MLNIPFKDSLLFWATPETEGEPFMYDLINQELSQDHKVLLCVTNKPSKSLINESKNYGYQLTKSSLSILDLSNDVLNKTPLNDLKRQVKARVDELGKEFVIAFNNISVLLNIYGEEAVKALGVINRHVTRKKGKSLLVFTEWPYEAELISKLRDEFKDRVYLNTIDEGGFLRKYYSLSDGPDLKHVMYKLEQPGGVKPITPRILVMEPEQGLIDSISGRAASIDQLSSDFGIKRGRLEQIDLFGASKERFKLMMDLMSDESTGVLVMVDPSKPESYGKTRQVINSAKKLGLRVMVGSDKMSVKELKRDLAVSGVNYLNLNENDDQDMLLRKLLN